MRASIRGRFASSSPPPARSRAPGGWRTLDDDLVVYFDDDSPPDDAAWASQLRAYQQLSVLEVVRFAAHEAPGRRLRVWDLCAGGFVEREIRGRSTRSRTLGHYWTSGAGSASGMGDSSLWIEDAQGRVVLDGVSLRQLWRVALDVSGRHPLLGAPPGHGLRRSS